VKLLIRHTFPVPPEVFWDAFWDNDLDARMQKNTAVHRHLVAEREEGGQRITRYRFVPEKKLPGPVAKIAGTDRLTYEQENRFDPATKVLKWKVFPAILPDKVTAEGTFTVRPTSAGCERVVEGKIEVRVPLVGGRIEQAIVTDVEAAYDTAAEVTRSFIAEKQK
jgi:hypothetical protein